MKLITALLITAAAFPALADEYVNGYVRRDGTYVQPHYRSTPNNTAVDNYGTQGNTNPYTGQAGHVNPYNQPQVQPMQPMQQFQPYQPYQPVAPNNRSSY